LLENNKVKIRALEPEDLSLLYKWENNTSIWKYSGTFIPFSQFTLKKYLENAHLDIFEAKQVRFVIEALDIVRPKAIGLVDLFDYEAMHNRAGIGILIGEQHFMGKGYASSALGLAMDYAFNILHLHQLYCNIGAKNEKSLKLFRKHGFDVTGTKRQWVFNGQEWEDELFLQHIIEQ
jgi:diamine N-acetyltransferase